MANPFMWYLYGTKFILRNRLIKKIKKKTVWPHYKCSFIEIDNASKVIMKELQSNKPFMAARIGFNEMSMLKAFDFHKNDKYEIVLKNMCDMAGFFPNDLSLGERFVECMQSAIAETDLLGLMNSPFEDYYVNQYMKREALVTPVDVFDFWKPDESWTKALKGKKVLVVHPFIESILSQYGKHRDKLFYEEDILPEFDLIPYKAIQTAGGEVDSRFENWFDALEFMKEEIRKIDFDVAIIGCGAYGFPLAADIRKSGKQAIHMGGVSQILFGIKGQRWTKEKNSASKIMNEYWVWPSDTEVPIDPERIEGGPYFKPTESYRKRIERSKD